MLEQTVFSFIKSHYDPRRPILLALSGGPDSLALYHLLLKHVHKKGLKLGVAHVDHGWRTESAIEAQQLETKVLEDKLPFHLKRLQNLTGNKEDASRRERLKFFKSLCQEFDYQAVLLAHHADDQAETVLKRIFEGSNLSNLGGLRACTTVEGVNIWRPLLNCSKQDLADWLTEHAFKGFEDATNLDPRYLRGKMRTSLLPTLSGQFGKEIRSSLTYLGEEAQLLSNYLDERIQSHIQRIERGPQGLFLDLTHFHLNHLIELSHLVRKFSEMGYLSLSRSALNTTVNLIILRSANKQIGNKSRYIFIDRGRLFLPHTKPTVFNQNLPLKVGKMHACGWTIDVSLCDEKGKSTEGWKAIWNGRCETWLPNGNYELRPASNNNLYPGNSPISKWWTDAKVPAFMRTWVPVVWSEGIVQHEFLTGQTRPDQKFGSRWLKICLKAELSF